MASFGEVNASVVPRPAGDAGRGLFATSTIKMGKDVFSMPATFSTVLSTERLKDACSNCFANLPFGVNVMASVDMKLWACSGCKVVKYCDRKCQSANWKLIHKHECAIYKKLYPKILPVNSRAVLRIVKLRSSNEDHVKSDLNMFLTLRSHLDEITSSNQEQYERIMLCAKAEKEYSGSELDVETIAEYLARIEVNSFTFTTAFGDPLGLCIQPFACYMNHSCEPNAVVGFDGGLIIVKALREIKPDEQVFISYIDNTYPLEVRQKQLAERYFFTCKCSKCAQGTTAREDQFIPSNPSSEEVETLKEAEKQARELLTAARSSKAESAVKQLRSAMKVLHDTKMWPIARQPYPEIRSELIVSLLEIEDFWSAFRHGLVRYLFVDPVLYPHEWHPIRTNHEFVFSQLVVTITGEQSSKIPNDSKYKFDPVSTVYPILAKLNKNLKYETPEVARSIKVEYDALMAPVRKLGYNPSTPSAAKAMSPAWKILNNIAEETLETDG
ncbi:SET and MYND domain protein, putative [Trichophyton verrucosum HKI 0517]|uniref:SET and MYND domain protein, putative n=1 Tax=Trichophyton verrucosum (strain HKI 0517) TaxID=663202 RepID=D4DIS0_TRIVH|nr:SET and MYND domain protein, putative [Trichophyton verrucosum HKI 0517]EFE38244.1 SET and MYND domain protein, putative [Trichophyton verrucosum HKI 0517]